MGYGLLAIREEKDGRHVKVAVAVLREILGEKLFPDNSSVGGSTWERDGVKWWTPGDGAPAFTKEVREKFIARCAGEGIVAEDWTAGDEGGVHENIAKMVEGGVDTQKSRPIVSVSVATAVKDVTLKDKEAVEK